MAVGHGLFIQRHLQGFFVAFEHFSVLRSLLAGGRLNVVQQALRIFFFFFGKNFSIFGLHFFHRRHFLFFLHWLFGFLGRDIGLVFSGFLRTLLSLRFVFFLSFFGLIFQVSNRVLFVSDSFGLNIRFFFGLRLLVLVLIVTIFCFIIFIFHNLISNIIVFFF